MNRKAYYDVNNGYAPDLQMFNKIKALINDNNKQ